MPTPLSTRRSPIRITNESGYGGETKLTDARTGEEITAKLPITRIVIDADDIIKATVHVALPAIDLVAHPETRHTATVVFSPDDPASVERAIESVKELAASYDRVRDED